VKTGILEIGKAVDKEDNANSVLKSYQDKVQQAQNTIKEAIGENKTLAFIRPPARHWALNGPIADSLKVDDVVNALAGSK
jgi:iron complex transport system substrate-binding protein